MKRAAILLGILGMVVGSIGIANAAVIDFEGLGDLTSVPSGYAGFNWSPDAWTIYKNYYPGSGYDYGTLGNVSLFTAWGNAISMNNSTAFDFNGAYITSAWDASEVVTVEGWRGGSLAYTENITTYNNSAYWFDFNYEDIDTVWFRPLGSHLDIDNITYNEQIGGPAVPEPMSLSLLGFGLLGAMGLRKRKV